MKMYLDLDGVLANFEKAVTKVTKQYYWGDYSEEFWRYIEKEPHFFYNLDVLPDALAMFDQIYYAHASNVEILTALPHPTGLLNTADQDKRAWVADIVNPNVKVNTIIGGKNKVKYLEDNSGAVLVDDSKRNIDLWFEAGGIGILHTDSHSTIEKLKVLKLL